MHSESIAPPPSRAVLPADGFEEPIVIHPVLVLLVTQDGNPACSDKRQFQNLPLLVGNLPLWLLMPPSSHRIVTVRLSVIPMVPRLVTRPKCQSKSVPASAARLASSSSEPALVIRLGGLPAGLSAAILSCSPFCAQDAARAHHLSQGHVLVGCAGVFPRSPTCVDVSMMIVKAHFPGLSVPATRPRRPPRYVISSRRTAGGSVATFGRRMVKTALSNRASARSTSTPSGSGITRSKRPKARSSR